MKKYSTIILDLDDTLIDNTKASKYAFKVISEYLGIPYEDNLFYEFLKFDYEYWYRWEHRTMLIPEHLYIQDNVEELRTYLRSNRFFEFFHLQDFDHAITINNLYCSNLGVDIESIEGAREILEYLYDKYRLAIATNGPYNAATNKLNKVDFKKYFTSIYCSEVLGFSKPDKKFWDALFNDLKEPKSNVIFIGDSLTTDIASGINNGFDTIWYNPQNKEAGNLIPTYEVNKLLEIKRRL